MADSWHGMAHHGVVEIDREGFVEVIELDPSSLLVSMHPSAVMQKVASFPSLGRRLVTGPEQPNSMWCSHWI